MVSIPRGVFDTGPLLHLHEADVLFCIRIVQKRYITLEIEQELRNHSVPYLKEISTLSLRPQYKNIAKFLCEQYALGLGEATAIALAQQEKISYFFTDDLEAREVGVRFKLEVHGTLGILLRAYREKIITKEQAISIVKNLGKTSSLFLTYDLLSYIIQEIEAFPRK